MTPGTYKVEAENPGFPKVSKPDVKLLVNTPTTLDLHMELGQTTETVSASPPKPPPSTRWMLRWETRSPKHRYDSFLCRPGNVVELLSLQPGVTTNGEVLGARRDQNNITLDGVDVNDNQSAGLRWRRIPLSVTPIKA